MNADNAVGSILPDELVDYAGLGLGEWGGSGALVVKAVGCCEISVEVDAVGVVAVARGHTVWICCWQKDNGSCF